MAVAAFTIVRNEPFFLPRWLAYYGERLGYDNLTVLDNEGDDGSTDGLPCEVVRVESGGAFYHHGWIGDVVAAHFAALLKRRHEVVVYSDVDEFLVHPEGIENAACWLHRGCARARGYDLVHMPGEAAYDLSRPILAQRSSWRRPVPPDYDKTLVGRRPLSWKRGFHRLSNKRHGPYLDGLTLVHLHLFDRGLARARHEARQNWRWNEEERAANRGWQWMLEGAALEAWFDEHLQGVEPVAEWLKQQAPF